MTFEDVLDQAIAMLQRRGRLTYRTLQRQFQLDDAALEDLKEELIYGQRLAVDEEGRVLVWSGATGRVRRRTSLSNVRASTANLHPRLPGREDPHLSQRPGRRTQTGDRAVCRPQRLHGTAGRARSRGGPPAP